MRSTALLIIGLVPLVLLFGCSKSGPDYKRPEQKTPEAFSSAGPWKEAAPQDTIAKGAWWEIFGDPVLNELEATAVKQSLDLRAAAARVEQAQAIAGISGTFLNPTVGLSASTSRYAVSGNRPDQPNKVAGDLPYTATDNRVPLYASYELDMWGRMRRLSEAADAQFEASVAAFYTILLTLQGEVAQTYFQLRANEEIERILRENITLRRQGKEIVAARVRNGLSSELDLARVEAELATTEGDVQAVAKTRTELTNRLAVLTGSPPERFKVEPRPFAFEIPALPVGLPSDLLQRRPDIADAERRLAARNAEIGVAKSAYFPSITLTGAVGFQSSELGDLLSRDSQIWSVGINVFQPIFNSGRIGFDVKRAEAAYAEGLAVYQGRILQAFQEVESSLSGLKYLDDQARFQTSAVQHAQKATSLATKRYQGGLVSLLDVIDAQRTSLQAERQAVQVTTTQLLSTVALVKALGGGWESRKAPFLYSDLPPVAKRN
jgi:multidrug efflux system outer membrane protein